MELDNRIRYGHAAAGARLWPGDRGKSEHDRTTVVGNTHPPGFRFTGNRGTVPQRITADGSGNGDQVRVKRCGKSAPPGW